MKYPDLNSANSYLFTLEWRKYFWVYDLFGSFIFTCLSASEGESESLTTAVARSPCSNWASKSSNGSNSSSTDRLFLLFRHFEYSPKNYLKLIFFEPKNVNFSRSDIFSQIVHWKPTWSLLDKMAILVENVIFGRTGHFSRNGHSKS